MRGLTRVEVTLNLPLGLAGLKGTWTADQRQRTAAWELYVELVTRVGVTGLDSDQGMLREAMDSLHSLFATTRAILREHGPAVARIRGRGQYSFGQLAVIVLNDALRPLLSKWHPRLASYERTRPPGLSRSEHERQWPHHDELRAALGEVRTTLLEYAGLLAAAAGVPSLLGRRGADQSSQSGSGTTRFAGASAIEVGAPIVTR